MLRLGNLFLVRQAGRTASWQWHVGILLALARSRGLEALASLLCSFHVPFHSASLGATNARGLAAQ